MTITEREPIRPTMYYKAPQGVETTGAQMQVICKRSQRLQNEWNCPQLVDVLQRSL